MEDNSSIVKTGDVINVKVKSNDGEDLGKIEEIILDKISGQVRYIVLSFGGLMGFGEKLFALPWKSISYDPDDECFTLKIDKEKIKNSPGFDKNHWPNFAEGGWEKTIDDHFRDEPY